MNDSRLYINALGQLKIIEQNNFAYIVTGVMNGGFNIYLKGDQSHRKVMFIYS